MTPEKLRAIAKWLDLVDTLLAKVDLVSPNGKPITGWREAVTESVGDEMQRDLRTWAAELEAKAGP